MTQKEDTSTELRNLITALKNEFYPDVSGAIADVMRDMDNTLKEYSEEQRIAYQVEVMIDLLYEEICRLLAPLPMETRMKGLAKMIGSTEERCDWYIQEFIRRNAHDQA
jgi:hypothetical protein